MDFTSYLPRASISGISESVVNVVGTDVVGVVEGGFIVLFIAMIVFTFCLFVVDAVVSFVLSFIVVVVVSVVDSFTVVGFLFCPVITKVMEG